MSQRPAASRPAPQLPPESHGITLPPVQLRHDGQHGGRDTEHLAGEDERRAPLPSPQLSQAAERTTQSGESWRSSTGRDHRLQAMLNPTEPDVKIPIEPSARGSVLQSPSFDYSRPSSTFGNSPTSTTPTSAFVDQRTPARPSSVSEATGGSLNKTRKILTPRSPLRSFSATRSMGGQFIDATRSPFLSGKTRGYGTDLSLDAATTIATPPLTSSTHQQSHYGFPSASAAPMAGRRVSGDSMHAPSHFAPSQSASPSLTASSHSLISNQTSPAGFPYPRASQAPATTTPYYPGSSFASVVQHGGGSHFHAESSAPEGPYSSQASSQAQIPNVSTSRQNPSTDGIQVLTISTAQGAITVPVDVHQASKLADEKRKRNAGASARFRQRRKDKEKEATTNIDKLNQQARDLERRVREVEQERDFYKNQRNRLRDIVYQTPEIRHHAQGPPSPRPMQTTPFHGTDSASLASSSSARGYSPEPTSSEERAPRRRRFDGRFDAHGNIVPLPYSQHPLATLPAVQQPATLSHPSGLPSLPSLRIEGAIPVTGPHSAGPPSTEAPGPSSQFPPFPQSQYERGWPPGERRM